MFRRFLSVVLAAVFAWNVCLPAAAAKRTGSVGEAKADGNYTLCYRSDGSGSDVDHDFYYSESFFDHPSIEYDHQLATVTLGLSLASFCPIRSDSYYWKDGDVGREENIADAFRTLGFGNARFYNYDINLNDCIAESGYAFAQKTLVRNGKRQTVFAVIVRGGGYGSEWASNVILGDGAEHEGFAVVADEVMQSLKEYIAAARENSKLGEVKLWVGGYSRGGAAANLLAAKIDHELPEIPRENVYVYTFASPAVLEEEGGDEYKLDYDNNHNADGTLKQTWSESNIFNIIGSGDLVPQIPPAGWGYHRNGNDRYLPMTSNSFEVSALNALEKKINPDFVLDFDLLGKKEDVATLIQSMEKVFIDKNTYCTQYEIVLADMLECAFQRSEEEVVQGIVLDNDAVMRRLAGLQNMGDMSLEKIVTSVWAASSVSRPLLERFGKNVPLRVQQLILPLVATGLCYDIGRDVVQLLAQYVIGIVSVRSAPSQAVNVFRCHYGEVYLTLMEYYEPAEHEMQAETIA